MRVAEMDVDSKATVDSNAAVDAHPWRSAVALGCLAILGGMFASLVLPSLLGRTGWWIPGDAWVSLKAAHYVPQGTYPLIYETGTLHDVFDAGPLLPLVLAPIAAFGDFFHLQESYPYPVAYPNMWLIFGPYALASAIPLMYATRALATQLKISTGRFAIQAAVLAFAFVPMAIVYGHYEDVIALALTMLAFRDLFAERELRGALFLAVAIAFKQWSALAVPMYVAACPAPLQFRAALRSLVPPVVFFSAFLAIDFRYAFRALFHTPTFAGLGHSALWIHPSADLVSGVPTRAGAFVFAAIVGWMMRRKRDPATIMAVLGCLFLTRFLFESVIFAYYLAPGIVLILMAEGARGRRAGHLVTKVILSAALLLAFPFHPARGVWWLVVYSLTAALLLETMWETLSGSYRFAGSDPAPSRIAFKADSQGVDDCLASNRGA